VRNSSELGVGGVPVLVLAAELGQRPKTKTHFQSLKNFLPSILFSSNQCAFFPMAEDTIKSQHCFMINKLHLINQTSTTT